MTHDEGHPPHYLCVCRCEHCRDSDNPTRCICKDCLCHTDGSPVQVDDPDLIGMLRESLDDYSIPAEARVTLTYLGDGDVEVVAEADGRTWRGLLDVFDLTFPW